MTQHIVVYMSVNGLTKLTFEDYDVAVAYIKHRRIEAVVVSGRGLAVEYFR